METVQTGAVSLLLLSVLYRHFLLTAHCLPPSHGHNPLRLCCLPHRIHILLEFLDDYWNIHVLMAQLCWYYFIILILAWICISIKTFHLLCQLIALFYSFIKRLISVTSVISRSFHFFKRFIVLFCAQSRFPAYMHVYHMGTWNLRRTEKGVRAS